MLIDSFGLSASRSPVRILLQEDQEILGAAAFLFVLWMGGVLLLGLNRSIIRLKEGYGAWNPAKLFAFIERRRFRRLTERLEEIKADLVLAEDLGEEKDFAERRRLRRIVARRFPDSEDLLLPTAFGNTILAFEVYSRVMYGIDAIPGWPRLVMVMPDNDREVVDTAKAQMSFWVNIWLLSLIFFVEYLALSIITGQRGTIWAVVSLPLAWFASRRARNAAVMWGEVVKASFDVYVPALRKKLELDASLPPDQERRQWANISGAMILRNPEFLPSYRDRGTSGKPENLTQ